MSAYLERGRFTDALRLRLLLLKSEMGNKPRRERGLQTTSRWPVPGADGGIVQASV